MSSLTDLVNACSEEYLNTDKDDTVNGKVIIKDSDIVLRSGDYTKGTPPLEAHYRGIYWTTNSDISNESHDPTRVACVEHTVATSGDSTLCLRPYFNTTDSVENASFNVTAKADGVTKTISAFGYNQPYQIKNYRSGANWYKVWSDGTCMQGGVYTTSGTSATISLLTPFSDANYSLVTTDSDSTSTDTEGVDYNILSSNKTTTTFRVSKAKSRYVNWFAVGIAPV